MITQFKLFEDEKIPIFNIEDYVLLDLDEMDKHNIEVKFNLDNHNYIDNMAKITRLNDAMYYLYHIEFYDGNQVNVREDEIIRLLTKDEIEEYETKKSALKYNL